MKKKNKGITLIALVITIIVLLILAGVSIATLGGENGIIARARKAKTMTEETQAKEEATLLVNEYEMYKKMCEAEGKEPNVAEFLEKNYKDRYKLEDGKYKITTESGADLEIDDKGNVKLNDEIIKANNAENITIDGETEVQIEQTITLTATIKEEGVMYKSIAWSSTDSTKAKVEGKGLTCTVTGIQIGEISIICKITNYDGTVINKVHEISIIGKKVNNITINGENAVEIGNNITLTAVIEPTDALYKNIEWNIDDSNKATINYNSTSCTVTGTAEGNVKITCIITNNDDTSVSQTYNVSVNSKRVTEITISGGTSVDVGASTILTANIIPSEAKYKKIEWSSNNQSIAMTSGNGTNCTVTGKAIGTATITCTITNNDESVITKTFEISGVNYLSKILVNTSSGKGKYVKYSANSVSSWRIFYLDSNNAYIITKGVVQKSLNVSNQTQFLSYFLDSNNWKEYVNTSYAISATGGPTLTQMQTSYGSNIKDDGTILTGDLYNCGYNWIFPTAYDSGTVYWVWGNYMGHHYYNNGGLSGYRPLVKLKSGIKVKGGDGSENNPYILVEQ